jgi:hypothetical protein
MIRAEATADIDASAAIAYDIIADYREGHPSILPPRYFTGLEVERGGRGAGTVIVFGMKAMGRVTMSRAEVSEPEPGRVLVETIAVRDLVTTFTVDPLGAQRSRVTIVTEWPARGVAGLIERLLAPAMLRRIYAEELALLNSVASERQAV